jgi:predicted anti-sigma-YlaC factor YlaD
MNAYLDGELHGNRLHHVEAHLVECEVCRGELESLERLTDLLQEIPVPEFTSPERLAAQVSLLLPYSKPATSRRRVLEISWWMIPIGLLAAWVFVNTSFWVSDILSVANSFGLLTSVSNWMMFGASNWSATLGQFGILSGNSLDLATLTESFTRTSLPQISFQISIALLYLSWIAIWWVRHRRQEHGQLLEN